SLEWQNGEADFLFCHLDEYYGEVLRFTKDIWGICLPPSVQDTLIKVQKAVMPEPGKTIPFAVELPHDFVAYFQQIRDYRNIERVPGDFRALATFPPGELMIDGIKAKTIDDLGLTYFDRFVGAGWELRS